MRRNVIAGRMGALDTMRFDTEADEYVTYLDLLSGDRRFDHGIGAALEEVYEVGLFPSEIGLDLLVLAAHVHAADTRISRATESQDSWTREIRLVVPVSEPATWNAAGKLLSRMLNFLTGDRWRLTFRPRPSEFAAAVRPRSLLATVPGFDSVSLFSGGLDSLVGAIDAFEHGRHPLLVSHAGEGATSDSQNACFGELADHYQDGKVERVRLWMHFRKNLVRGVQPEDTTRGRSFLFIALGLFAGTGLGKPFVLHVPENGLIALNAPLDFLRLGSLSTRTTHPFFLARWNELLRALGIGARVENPYWSMTKGEMVAGCANQNLLKKTITRSQSCSSPTKGRWKGRGIEHCGYCAPCLIRRAAVQAAYGRGNDPTLYGLQDLGARPLHSNQAEGQQVRSFQLAARRLQARPELAAYLIVKPGPLRDVEGHHQELAEVYRRGIFEVAALLDNVRTQPI